MDLGLEKAGFDIAMVSEKNEPFLESYKYSRNKMQLPEPEHGYFNKDISDYLNETSTLDKFMSVDKKIIL